MPGGRILFASGFRYDDCNIRRRSNQRCCSGDQFRREDRITMRADDAKAILTELFRPGWTNEEGHVAPGLGKPAAKVAANRTGADDKDPGSRRDQVLS